MTDNLRYWTPLSKTDPDQTKAFQRSGGFKGTAVKPIYCDQRMTEQFGPCGKGWGIGRPEFQTVPAGNELLVFCTVEVWWREDTDDIHSIFGVGGDKVIVVGSNGPRNSDEAFKMSLTDAIGNAMKHLGMSADIHMGLFDDNKYVAALKAEKKAEDAPKHPPHDPETGEVKPTPTAAESQARAIQAANAVASDFDKAKTDKALAAIKANNAKVVSRLFEVGGSPLEIYQRALRRTEERLNVTMAG